MKEEPKNRCKELNFAHSWENTTPDVFYPTNPLQYPDREETCVNCGITRIFRKRVEEWIEYVDNRAL